MRRSQGVPRAIAKPDRIAVAEHNVVRAGSAVDGLVEVIAHRVTIGEVLEVRRISLLHVVKAHGVVEPSPVVVVGLGAYSVLKVDAWGRPFVPAPTVTSTQWKQSGAAAGGGGIFPKPALAALAIHLLPHLVEAVNRACGVCVVIKSPDPFVSWNGPGGDEFTFVMRVVGSSRRQARASSGNQSRVVARGWCTFLRLLGEGVRLSPAGMWSRVIRALRQAGAGRTLLGNGTLSGLSEECIGSLTRQRPFARLYENGGRECRRRSRSLWKAGSKLFHRFFGQYVAKT